MCIICSHPLLESLRARVWELRGDHYLFKRGDPLVEDEDCVAIYLLAAIELLESYPYYKHAPDNTFRQIICKSVMATIDDVLATHTTTN